MIKNKKSLLSITLMLLISGSSFGVFAQDKQYTEHYYRYLKVYGDSSNDNSSNNNASDKDNSENANHDDIGHNNASLSEAQQKARQRQLAQEQYEIQKQQERSRQIAQQQAERQKQQEQERLIAQQQEQERLIVERQLAQQQAEKQKQQEKERLIAQQQEQERLIVERQLAQQQAERQKQQEQEQERLIVERQLAQQQAEKQKQLEKERLIAQQQEQERLIAEQLARQKSDGQKKEFISDTIKFKEGNNIAGIGYLDEAKQSQVKVYKIANTQSQPQESMIDFVKRSGLIMSEYTKDNEFETCSRICKRPDNGQYGMVITTSKSHFFCAISSLCPEDMSEYGFTVHTHPKAKRYKMNEVDMSFMIAKDVNALSSNIKIGSEVEVHQVNKFSDHDYNSGPGFLIADEQLYFQNNKNIKYKKIGSIKDSK